MANSQQKNLLTLYHLHYLQTVNAPEGYLVMDFSGALPVKAFGILILKAIQSYYCHCQQSLVKAIGILFETF